MKKTSLALFIIIFLAGFLRFYKLGENPPALTWDEAAWGYNAYSLGIDGRDEFGKFLPIQYLESFGDFKPVLYAYLSIIPVKIFGLTEFAVRFPSALFGVLTVAVTYFLTKEIFSKLAGPARSSSRPTCSPAKLAALARRDALRFCHPLDIFVALMASFLLAISPWHINLSRAAFEANVASFFINSGVWLWLVAVQQGDSGPNSAEATLGKQARMTKTLFLVLSTVSFVLSMYTFNTARIVSPLLVLILMIGFREKLESLKKETMVAGIFGIIIFIPLAIFLISPQAKLRFNEVNIFSDLGIIERTNQEIKNDNGFWWSKIIHNRRVAYGQEFLKHYLDHFNPAFLFIKGDGNPKFSTQDVGQLYLWEAPFLVLGIFWLLRKREGYWWIIPLWLLIGILPAATARETPHALRIEASLPTWQIITSLGFSSYLSFLGKINIKRNFKFCLVLLPFTFLFFNFIYYLHGYYAHYAREYSGEWQYGYKEAIEYVKSVEKEYDKIYFTESLGRPYIYFLFYNKVSPSEFRQTAKIWREVYGFVHVDGYGKYEFMTTARATDPKDGKILLIDSVNNLPGGARRIKTFNLLNGNPVLTAYTR